MAKARKTSPLDRYFPGHFMGDEEIIAAQQKLKSYLHQNMKQISQSLDNLKCLGRLGNRNNNRNGIYPKLINSVVPLGHVQCCVQKVLNCREYNFCSSTESNPNLHCSDWEPRVVKKTVLKSLDEILHDQNMFGKKKNGLGINIVTHKLIHVSNILL